MQARQVSAQFAAYVWFTNQLKGLPTTEQDAIAFARKNWRQFLPSAPEGLGRLLLRIAKGRGRCQRRKKTARSCQRARVEALAG